MAIFGIAVIFAPLIGPVLGGWITENWSWPWIYLINVPLGFFVCLSFKKPAGRTSLCKKTEKMYILILKE